MGGEHLLVAFHPPLIRLPMKLRRDKRAGCLLCVSRSVRPVVRQFFDLLSLAWSFSLALSP